MRTETFKPLTKKQKARIRSYVGWAYSKHNARNVKIHADGRVTAWVDRMPNTDVPGTMVFGYDVDLVQESLVWGTVALGGDRHAQT
jgi:hypothetical protein